MRIFEKLDETSLRAFYYAAETLNFTRAAEAAALTQSGISQHIARLEEELGVSLFLRRRRQVQLTESGRILKTFAESYLDQVDNLLERLRHETQELRGLVRYAMPNSCLKTPHFPILLNERKKFPGIELAVTICHSPQVIDLLLSGEIDFGFVTSDPDHHELLFSEFAREEYILVSSFKGSLQFKNQKELQALPFVNYPGMDVLFEKWQKSVYPKRRPLKISDLNIAGKINSLEGAITMVHHGLGMSVFPSHCVPNEFFAYKLRCKENPIYIVQLKDQHLTSRAKRVLDTFWAMK